MHITTLKALHNGLTIISLQETGPSGRGLHSNPRVWRISLGRVGGDELRCQDRGGPWDRWDGDGEWGMGRLNKVEMSRCVDDGLVGFHLTQFQLI